MRSLVTFGVVLMVASLQAAPVVMAAQVQLPMDNFRNAFYTCDDGGAFLVSYDTRQPKEAIITTSTNPKKHQLKRTTVAEGAKFSGETISFWTDGKTVVVEGTEAPMRNCKLKTS